jgi:hypothetical protein
LFCHLDASRKTGQKLERRRMGLVFTIYTTGKMQLPLILEEMMIPEIMRHKTIFEDGSRS